MDNENYSDVPLVLETTMMGYERRTAVMGVGVTWDMLTDEEKSMVAGSGEYIKGYERKEKRRTLKLARNDFEKLRDIPNMPEEAIDILRNWTIRDEDEEHYADYDEQ